MRLPNHTALKEWSNVIDALGRGEQVILIRKGGLADRSFGVEAPRFYLYPTYFHQGETEARPSVDVTHWAEVVTTWTLRELDQLSLLEPLVVIPRDTLEARYRFRPGQALHVIGVRVHRLPVPSTVRFRDEYAGCRSWLSVEEEIDTAGSTQVLVEADLQTRLAAVDALLTVAT